MDCFYLLWVYLDILHCDHATQVFHYLLPRTCYVWRGSVAGSTNPRCSARTGFFVRRVDEPTCRSGTAYGRSSSTSRSVTTRAGHPGMRRTLALVERGYYWPGGRRARREDLSCASGGAEESIRAFGATAYPRSTKGERRLHHITAKGGGLRQHHGGRGSIQQVRSVRPHVCSIQLRRHRQIFRYVSGSHRRS